MTPFLRPHEVAEMQRKAQEALRQSKNAEGLEKLRLINAAFPFAIQGNPNGLRIAWYLDSWSISDTAGFITSLPKDDVVTMLVMIGMENARRGSVREAVTGKKRKESLAKPAPMSEPTTNIVKKKKPTLESLGLTNLKVGE